MMADQVLAFPDGARINLLAPLVRGKKGEFQKEFKKLLKDGFVRVRVDGRMRDLGEEIALDRNRRHDIDVVVDRLIVLDHGQIVAAGPKAQVVEALQQGRIGRAG